MPPRPPFHDDAPSGWDSSSPELHREWTIWDQKFSLFEVLIEVVVKSPRCYLYIPKRNQDWRVSMKDFQRILRIQLRRLERQQALLMVATKEVKRRIDLLDEVASWNPSGGESA